MFGGKRRKEKAGLEKRMDKVEQSQKELEEANAQAVYCRMVCVEVRDLAKFITPHKWWPRWYQDLPDHPEIRKMGYRLQELIDERYIKLTKPPKKKG